ncbi:hypothetical protein AXG93_1976s1140 [Marchantia polymorpha subsp. ruderalis]|uniref:Uncharacterized protein n=1 Tax=Marchantia polymorpha subsp. ruderalis TaxID=1480154 RepID=A0A176VDN3_MARPO|nr:hypothetical protein AXG93_1976s1140 [Marchantia polymorpha subsp. ruderalis]
MIWGKNEVYVPGYCKKQVQRISTVGDLLGAAAIAVEQNVEIPERREQYYETLDEQVAQKGGSFSSPNAFACDVMRAHAWQLL